MAALDPTDNRGDVLAKWRSRSRLIRVLRFALPAGLVVLALWVAGETAWRQSHAPAPAVQAQTPPEQLVNPRMVGLDDQGHSFEISATKALRDESDPDQVQLQDVTVVLHGDTPNPARVSARGGVYRQSDGLIHLQGGVRVDDGAGNRFNTETSVVDTKAGTIQGGGGVSADGALGQITAGAYSGHKANGEVQFSGGVRARLNSR